MPQAHQGIRELNLSFETEQDIKGWTPANWQQGKVDVKISDIAASQGRKSLLLERDIEGGYSALSSPAFDIPIKKGQLLRAELWCMNLTNSTSFHLVLQPGGKKLRTAINEVAEWGEKMKIKWVADADYEKLQVRFFCSGKGKAFFDNLKISVSDGSETSLFEHVPYEPQRKPQDIAEVIKGQDLVIFTTSAVKKVYPNYIPAESEIVDKHLNVTATPGEYEPLCIGIYAPAFSGKLNLEIIDLNGPARRIFSSNNIEVRRTRMMPLRIAGYDYTIGPKILEKDKPLEIHRGQTGQFWLTFHVPAETSAGRYTGKILLKQAKKTLKTLDVTLNVPGFKLIEPTVQRYMFIGWIMRDYFDQGEKLRAAFEDMKAHGMTTIHAKMEPGHTFGPDGRLLLDFAWVDNGIEIFKEVFNERTLIASGVNNLADWICRQILSDADWMQKDLQDNTPLRWKLFEYGYGQIVDHLNGLGIEPFMFVYDEPGGHRWRDLAIVSFKHAKNARPNAKIAVTTTEEFAETMNDYLNVNMFAYYAHDFDPDRAREFSRKSGDAYWMYGQCWSNLPHAAATLRYEAGLYAWKNAAQGIGWWVYRVPAKDPYNDLDGGHQDFMSSYPTDTGTDPTINWEAIREGIDDMKYLYTLEYYLDRAKTNPESATAGAVTHAQNLLTEIRKSVTVQHPYVVVPNWLEGILTAEQMDDYRSRVATAISDLLAVVNE